MKYLLMKYLFAAVLGAFVACVFTGLALGVIACIAAAREETVTLAEDLEPFREEIEEWVKEERDAEEIADAAWGKRQDQIDDGDEP